MFGKAKQSKQLAVMDQIAGKISCDHRLFHLFKIKLILTLSYERVRIVYSIIQTKSTEVIFFDQAIKIYACS